MHPEPPHFVNMIRTASSMFRACVVASVHVRTCPSRVVPSAADGAADGVCASHGTGARCAPVLVGPFTATSPPALGLMGARACVPARPVHIYIIPMLLHPEPQG